MEPACDNRFDPNHSVQMLLEISHEQSLDRLLHKLVDRAVELPYLVCAQVWLIDKGDLCPTCPHKSQCADQSRCLHLVAGNGVPFAGSGPDVPRFHDPSARMPLGLQ